MTISNKIPFGVREGVLVGVEDVESGLRCACVCPVCRRALQARKGDVVSHYFAHNPSDDDIACESALETAVHLMAKQILSEEKIATLPGVIVNETQYDLMGNAHRMTQTAVMEARVVFDDIAVERKFGDIRPDLIGYVDGVPVLIEIFVTHKCDRSKRAKIRDRGVAAIEIDLSGSQYTITKKELAHRLLSEAKNKKWISHPDVPEIKRRLRFSLGDKIRAINKRLARGVVVHQDHRSSIELQAATDNDPGIHRCAINAASELSLKGNGMVLGREKQAGKVFIAFVTELQLTVLSNTRWGREGIAADQARLQQGEGFVDDALLRRRPCIG